MEQDAFTITEQDIELLRFVVKDGKKEIQNIKISPLLDNFDYVGGGGKFKGGVRLVDINEEEFKYLQAKKELLDWGERILQPEIISDKMAVFFEGI